MTWGMTFLTKIFTSEFVLFSFLTLRLCRREHLFPPRPTDSPWMLPFFSVHGLNPHAPSSHCLDWTKDFPLSFLLSFGVAVSSYGCHGFSGLLSCSSLALASGWIPTGLSRLSSSSSEHLSGTTLHSSRLECSLLCAYSSLWLLLP